MTTFEQQELAEKVYEQITQHPETHNQRVWIDERAACGTAACVAGWAIALSPLTNYRIDEYGPKFTELGDGLYFGTAQYLLGIDGTEASRLFHTDLKHDVVVEAVKYLANGKDVDWQKLKTEYGNLLEEGHVGAHMHEYIYEEGWDGYFL